MTGLGLAYAVLAGFCGLLVWLLCRSRYNAGARDRQVRQSEVRDEALRQAKLLRDRLEYDADFAERVRRRFGR